MAAKGWLALALLGIIVLAMVLLGWSDIARLIQPERLVDTVRSMGLLGSLLLAALMVLAVVIGPIPTVPITVSAGAVYGPWLGFALAMGSALLGALLSFWIARFVARDFVLRVIGGHTLACAHCSDRLLFGMVLVARLIPVVSFAAVSYGAGLTAMSARAFLIATAVGMVPMTALYVAVGTTLSVDPYWAAFGGLLLVGLLFGVPKLAERLWPDLIERLHDKWQPEETVRQDPSGKQR